MIKDGEINDADLVYGLIQLATILLAKLEKAGHPVDTVLADIGTRYRRP